MVTYAIAKDLLPFNTVEKPGFKSLVGMLDKRYIIPGRKYFSCTAIPSLYSSTREKVQAELKGVIFFSATTDVGELCPIRDKMAGLLKALQFNACFSSVNVNLLCCIMDILQLCWCDFHDCLQGEHLTRNIFSGTVEAR